MDAVVVEQVQTKVEEVVEQQIAPKVEEKVAEVTIATLEQTQTVVEDTTKKASDAVVAAVESSVVVQKVEALIESNPQAKAVVEKLDAALV